LVLEPAVTTILIMLPYVAYAALMLV